MNNFFTIEEVNCDPEKNLIAAVIQQAVVEANANVATNSVEINCRNSLLRQQARSFLSLKNSTFIKYCNFLDINPLWFCEKVFKTFIKKARRKNVS